MAIKRIRSSSSKTADDDWPDHVRADVTLDAYFQRMSSLKTLLRTKGEFEEREAFDAVSNVGPETKEKPAKWLRSELKKLRDCERKGDHSVRRGKTLSRLSIAALAFTMLESTDALGDELLSLFQELLNLDRHRRTLSSHGQFDDAANTEAQFALQGEPMGVRKLQRTMKISASTASQWKRAPEYRERVDF
jgi:hypothetical protein